MIAPDKDYFMIVVQEPDSEVKKPAVGSDKQEAQ